MGCDIHFYVELREPGGPWVTADKWRHAEYDAEGQVLVDYEDSFYTDRNYDLFSILANVRNGSGFAGVKTGDGFVPIALPRGVPDDACLEYKTVVADYGSDGHSHSYLTLAEVLAYDFTQVANKEGWVDVRGWARARDNAGRGPESWAAMIGGGNVTHLTSKDFEDAWEKLRADRGYPKEHLPRAHLIWDIWEDKADREEMVELLGGGSPYCLVRWQVPYYRQLGSFWQETVPRLLSLGEPENVRMTFFFDN